MDCLRSLRSSTVLVADVPRDGVMRPGAKVARPLVGRWIESDRWGGIDANGMLGSLPDILLMEIGRLAIQVVMSSNR